MAAGTRPTSYRSNVRDPLEVRAVRSHLARAIDDTPAGLVSLVSLCAGQGHDVIGSLSDHPRRDDVRALLVESDARNAELARRSATQQGLPHVEVREAVRGARRRQLKIQASWPWAPDIARAWERICALASGP